MNSARTTAKGFTLLEVMIALAILAVSLVAIAAINAGAINAHAYSKKLTVATLLARSKMADIESQLHAKGFPMDDDVQDGDFEDEGFATYKWEAQIIRPKTEKISTNDLLNMMGTGLTDANKDGAGSAAGISASAMNAMNKLPGATASPAAANAGSMLAGPMQMQLQGMLDQLGKTMREVRVTVMWPDGKRIEKFTVTTHVVSLGPGTDQLQSDVNAQSANGGQQGVPGMPGTTVGAPAGLPPIPGMQMPNNRIPATGTGIIPAPGMGGLRTFPFGGPN